MNTEEKINATSSAANATQIFSSTGESFADGAMIELVSGSTRLNKPNLLLWNARKAKVGSRVEHGGCTYEPPELDVILTRAMRFPAGCRDYGSTQALFDGIRDLFMRHVGLPELESRSLTYFAISTWLADRLMSAPALTISGNDEEIGVDVLRLLSCVCRHPLMLAELTVSGFRSLPMQLSPTLLIDQKVLRPSLGRLFRASCFRGLHLSGTRGGVIDLYCPRAVFCGDDTAFDFVMGGGAIHISVPPSTMHPSPLDEQVQEEIATAFQPRLLLYRCKNFGKIRECGIDLTKFTSAMRPLARNLAQCFPGDSELARDAVQLLLSQDKELREQGARNVNCAIVEILWQVIHDGKLREIRVNKLTAGVNSLLRHRGEIIEYSPEEIGWKLRTTLRIPRHDDSSGREILLTRDTSQHVHRLAQDYDLLCAQSVDAGCRDCHQAQASAR